MSPTGRSEPTVVAPHLPRQLRPLEVEGLVDDSSWEGSEVRGDCAAGHATDVDISESLVRSVPFTGARVEGLQATDTVFEGCDLSGLIVERARLTRVEFRSCRLLGVVAIGAALRDVRFVDCRLDDANLRMATGERVVFESSSMRGIDLYDAELADARFLGCDLAEAQFSNVRLPGGWFEHSALGTIHGAASLRGVTIDPAQIVPLALRLFGTFGIAVADDEPPS